MPPNYQAILDIVAHFLSPDLQLRHALVGFKEIDGIHGGENLTEYLISSIQKVRIEDKFGVSIGDNAGSIDAAVETVVLVAFGSSDKRLHRQCERSFSDAKIINLGFAPTFFFLFN